MAAFWAAVAMLTRLPASSPVEGPLGARWFSLVGALVGLAGAVPLLTLSGAVPAGAAILAIGIITIVSGALHLDGLADTADALVAIGPGAAERARKDPAVGVAGAAALILVLGLEVTSLATLAGAAGGLAAGLACLVACSSSRAVPVAVALVTRSQATGAGLGAIFARRVSVADATIAALVAFGVAVVAAVVDGRDTLLVGSVLGLVVGVALGLGVVRLRGQLDGDGLGAALELGFAAIVLSMVAFARWPAA
jgi:adenosylcobinamide-GDP ribazoletransferase